MSKKKLVILLIIMIISLIMIGGFIYWISKNRKDDSEVNKSKIAQLNAQLQEKQTYSFTTTLDENNSTFYAKKDKTAYINTKYKSDETKFVIKDGNSYLLVDDEKVYYTYKNNETNLEKISLELSKIKDKQYTEGKETIKNKVYKYEEYEGSTDFLVKDVEDEELTNAKTRFYFTGDKLEYIKTIIGEYQELLKVEISNKVDNKLFEIPSNYKEM